ncbi:centromere protein Scm3-domain-containing protein [Aspergillus cavernicola]|uniref:Centromere protein Scm3-domain-containing protein n=1 Tax=Aspergillus cavernicola TaxID=176166 RepID=A0ABR4IVK0_9EURO
MESPQKRKRLSPSPETEEDPGDVDLHEARAQNDLRLKSIFEGIFEKYGRDFTDVGDEIDLQTGDILVNNGHIHELGGEENAGAIGDWLKDPNSPTLSNERPGDTGEERDRAHLHAQRTDDAIPDENNMHSGRRVVSILSQMLPDPDESREIADEDGEAEDDRSSVDSLLDTALCVHGTHSREIGTDEAVAEKAIPPAEGSNQSQAKRTGRLDEIVDPIWRVPEISDTFTTPTLLSRSRPKPIVNTARPQSPPGTGSLWALPSRSRRNTDVVQRKQKDSPKKRKKHQFSPAACDWSFADAPDGSESDDPLQEDYEPSPTPKDSVYIREKRRGPLTASHTKNTSNDSKQTFPHDDYVPHLRAVLPDPADNEHDLIHLKRQLDTVTVDRAPGSAPNTLSTLEPNVRTTNTPTSGAQETDHDSTPTGGKGDARTVIRPEEARRVIQMREILRMNWTDILEHFPQKNLSQLRQWYQRHWKNHKANPPRLSRPWSKAELTKLERLKDQPDLTWRGICAELPGRSHAEAEFKLLQLWAGDEVGST